jgi:hypothetical protein
MDHLLDLIPAQHRPIATALWSLLRAILEFAGGTSAVLAMTRGVLNKVRPGRTRAVLEALDLLLHRFAINTEPLIARSAPKDSIIDRIADSATEIVNKSKP